MRHWKRGWRAFANRTKKSSSDVWSVSQYPLVIPFTHTLVLRTSWQTKTPSAKRKKKNVPNKPNIAEFKQTSTGRAIRMQSARWTKFRTGSGTRESLLQEATDNSLIDLNLCSSQPNHHRNLRVKVALSGHLRMTHGKKH